MLLGYNIWLRMHPVFRSPHKTPRDWGFWAFEKYGMEKLQPGLEINMKSATDFRSIKGGIFLLYFSSKVHSQGTRHIVCKNNTSASFMETSKVEDINLASLPLSFVQGRKS